MIAPLPAAVLATLDPGIRDVVVKLREQGFETTDSGDGSKADTMGCAWPFPMAVAVVERDHLLAEADRMAALWPDWRVEASYAPGGPSVLMMTQPPTDDAA